MIKFIKEAMENIQGNEEILGFFKNKLNQSDKYEVEELQSLY